ALEPREDLLHETPDALERGAFGRVQERRVGLVEQRQRNLLADGAYNRALAAEVMVDRPLGDLRRGGDLLQRGARDAVAVEALERRLDDRRACLRRLFLGPAHRPPRNLDTF